ncbi:MAG: hypothetical protein HZA52_09225 [Planctomycetes bacterium]|nr:hypothetical protein [Planctomycetota bacterium]
MLSLLGALLAVEVGARLLARSRGAPFDPEVTRHRIAAVRSGFLEVAPETDGRGARTTSDSGPSLSAHPNCGFEFTRVGTRLERELAYFASPAAQANYDVVVLGGSVASAFGISGGARLERLLASDPLFAGRTIRVWSHGVGAYKQPQSLNLLNYLLGLGCEPDAVILVDGFNELAVANQNATDGVSPAFPWAAEWLRLNGDPLREPACFDALVAVREARARVLELCDDALAGSALESAVLARRVWTRIDGARADANDAQARFSAAVASSDAARHVRGLPVEQDVLARLRACVRAWRFGSDALRAICREQSIAFVHVLQPTLLDEGSKPLTAGERERGRALRAWSEAIRLGYPLVREASRELVARGATFVDATDVFHEVAEDLYEDACHFNQRGVDLLVDRVVPALAAEVRRH